MPGVAPKRPTAQGRHAVSSLVCCARVLNLPLEQLVHSGKMPPGENLPAAHGTGPPLVGGQEKPSKQYAQLPGGGVGAGEGVGDADGVIVGVPMGVASGVPVVEPVALMVAVAVSVSG
jgi:hypothetical protein